MSLVYSGSILELKNVAFRYSGNERLVDGLDLSLGSGELVGLLGANGSGKSTVLKLAAGMLQPASGEVLLWNRSLAAYRNKDRAKLLCYLPQQLDVTVPFTVAEIVAMGTYPYEVPPQATIGEALDMVGLADKRDAYIANLSGGERRRVFIAMTLLQGAGILLLDEPLANLDIKYQIEFLRLLRTLQETKGISVILALHDINLALQFEKVVLLKNGSVLGRGSAETVLTKPMLREAFDVDIEVRKAEHGAYITHGKWI